MTGIQLGGRTVKLVIQIPCRNEAETLPATLAGLPGRIPGIDDIEIVIIDDGSEDGTRRVAERHGISVRRFARRRGLARAFVAGLEEALARGADVIVNTDGDHQYRGADIPKLVAPVVRGEADVVVGARQIEAVAEFSRGKKTMQRLGSGVIRWASQCDVTDAASGFRAYSRDAAERITIVNGFSHTLETLLQARPLGLAVCEVPIRRNADTRPSRLAGSTAGYLLRSAWSLVSALAAHRPLGFVSLVTVMAWALTLAAGSALTFAGSAFVIGTALLAAAEVLQAMAEVNRQRADRREAAARGLAAARRAEGAREEAEPWTAWAVGAARDRARDR